LVFIINNSNYTFFFCLYNYIVESAKGEIDAFDKAENDLIKLEQALLDEEAVLSPIP
jgi:hypothetical protein